MPEWGAARPVPFWPRSSVSGGGYRQRGSHRVLVRVGFSNLVFAFHDGEEIGPRMLARIAKHSGLKPTDL
ncbi:MAG: hypothetical protein RJA70_4655 [Pseudomonadota bacterium]